MVMTSSQSVRALALKIAGYGAVHVAVAFAVTYALTRDARLSLAVAVIEPFLQTVAYGLYDRLWHRLDRRRRLGSIEETAEAFTARLDLMNPDEQSRSHGVVETDRPSPRPPSSLRVAIKTGGYTVLHLGLAIGVVLALTQDWRIALLIGVAEPILHSVVFRLFDRLWTRSHPTPARSRAASA